VKADVDRIIQTAIDNFGKIDILVNNAGVSKPNMLYKMTEDQWNEVIDIQLKGPSYAPRPHQIYDGEKIRENYQCDFISGVMGNKRTNQLQLSKRRIIALTKSAARELAAYGITVNVVQPGYVSTEMTEKIRTDPKLKEILRAGFCLVDLRNQKR